LVNKTGILDGVAFHCFKSVENGVCVWKWLATDSAVAVLLSAFLFFQTPTLHRLAALIVGQFLVDLSA